MDAGDSAFFAWQIGWELHALKTDPAGLPHANIFHPLRYVLGMDEPVFGTTLLVAPLAPFTGDPVLLYNLARLLTFFVSALSACHMLWFLHLACQKRWVVDRYVDDAVGVLEKTWISRVTLRPRVTFSGGQPSAEELRALHHAAHEKCFIANSVKTEVSIEPC